MNDAIQELKDDGTLDKIMANYIGDDTGSYQYETPEGTEYTNGTLTMGPWLPTQSLSPGSTKRGIMS